MAAVVKPEIGSESYFRQLAEQMGIALIATDLDLNIQIWNAAAARMFGAAADRMIGTPAASIVPQERRMVAERMLRRALESGQTYQFAFQHRDIEGHQRELAGTIAPVISESGDCIGTSVCVRDITQRIHLQNELNESRKMVSLGALAGGIAHHFNNILGGVITSVDFALTGNDPAITNRVLQQTGKALQRATTLVNGLLAFAEGGHHPDDLGDFTEIIFELADEVEALIKGRGIDFELNIPKLPILPMARTQVLTVFHNIVQNAIEAMPQGGTLTIDVSLKPDWAVTCITDTGVGLDETARSHIFEPFWSTKGALSSSTTDTEGTGLGLAIAHGVAQTIGGVITVTSEPKKGSSFKISLPRPDVVPE